MLHNQVAARAPAECRARIDDDRRKRELDNRRSVIPRARLDLDRTPGLELRSNRGAQRTPAGISAADQEEACGRALAQHGRPLRSGRQRATRSPRSATADRKTQKSHHGRDEKRVLKYRCRRCRAGNRGSIATSISQTWCRYLASTIKSMRVSRAAARAASANVTARRRNSAMTAAAPSLSNCTLVVTNTRRYSCAM